MASTQLIKEGFIEVRGARQNNLSGIDVNIPKRSLVVFTGVSGSGKSSLVFGTIAAESQRLINETYNAFLQSLMPALPRPDVDLLRGLNAAIVVDQERMGANSRSTVGTATDTWTMLRVLFSRLGKPAVSSTSALSFNDPVGMCLACEGLGSLATLNVDSILDRTKSLTEGAITFPNFAVGSIFWEIFAKSGFFDIKKPLKNWTKAELGQLLTGTGGKVGTGSYKMTYEGLIDKIKRLYLTKDLDDLQPHIRQAVEAAAAIGICSECSGTRLNEEARRCMIQGKSIADANSIQINDLVEWARKIKSAEVAPIVLGLLGTLENLVEIGLGYLSLDRQTGTLSGGEAQRVKMVRHLDSSLTDMTYVFDEPTSGLHAHDTERVIALLKRLRDKGNTVLVVEHNLDVISAADHIIELGPGAGTSGGKLVFQGDLAGLRKSKALTAKFLDTRQPIKTSPRKATGHLKISKAKTNNLKNISVEIPLGVLTAVTGVAGSGKSSLVLDSISRDQELVIIDQTPIQGSRRSNPATYSGALDGIRDAFAKENKVKPALFSANSDGACEACKGLGVTYTDLAYMAAVSSKCEVCGGRRFADQVLKYKLRGANISEVLAMTINDAAEFFTEKNIQPLLSSLSKAGIGYISLGQPLTTLSGGERQRLRLGIEMAGKAKIYVLDEPSNGLHLADVEHLIETLDQIVESGGTVIVIEHNLDVIARADWVIDLGPGAGNDGGQIVYQGPPAGLPRTGSSLTGKHLHRTRRKGSA